MANPLMVDVNDATFQNEVLEAREPVLVDFWATWCAPCKALNPVLEEMAKTYQGRLKIAKFNVEQGIQTPQRYGVTSLPRLLFFKKGAVASAIAGAPAKAKLVEAIEQAIS